MIYYYDRYQIAIRSRLTVWLNRKNYTRHFLKFSFFFSGKKGLEIGGPSKLFTSAFLPIYQWATTVDGCNFSSRTLWEGSIQNTDYQYLAGKTGHQFILEGTDLHKIQNEQYDFLLSSHNLEHIANPLQAIKEWVRILKPGGTILLVLPDKHFTFDRNRPYTEFQHLLDDYTNKIEEDDLSHLSEILELHDLKLDPKAGRDYSRFKERSKSNLIFRGLHHHVYSQQLLDEIFAYSGIKTLDQYFVPPYHQIIIGQKPL